MTKPKLSVKAPISSPARQSRAKSKATPAGDGAKDALRARKGGRPSLYTPALIEEIFQRIANGEPLRQICRDEHMPHWNTVYDWLERDQSLSVRFARARERGEEAIAAECLDIADSAKNDWMEAHGQDDAGYKLNGEHIQRSKLRIETRLKLLAKWNPKKWGDKVDLNHGVQPENPLASMLQRIAGTGLPIVKDGDQE
ncbi:MAG: terminase small subunit protein [Aestuariivirga sp.]